VVCCCGFLCLFELRHTKKKLKASKIFI
jgi:hypothetical protein